MTSMDNREKAFENKFALDQELSFKVEARAVKLFSLWLAGEMGMNDDETKALSVSLVSSNLDEAGFEDVKRALAPVLEAKSFTMNDDMFSTKMLHFMDEAKKQIMEEKA